MGAWEFIGSIAESVKRNASDATPLKNAFATSNSYSSAGITKIDQAVRNNAPSNLGQLIPDDETKSKIGLFTTKLAKNAGQYAIQDGYKLIPGGVAFSNILSKTLDEVKHENLTAQKLETLAEKVDTPQKHSSGGQKLSDGAELPSWELVFWMI